VLSIKRSRCVKHQVGQPTRIGTGIADLRYGIQSRTCMQDVSHRTHVVGGGSIGLRPRRRRAPTRRSALPIGSTGCRSRAHPNEHYVRLFGASTYARAGCRGGPDPRGSRHGFGHGRIAVRWGRRPPARSLRRGVSFPGRSLIAALARVGVRPGPVSVVCGAGDRAGYASRAGDLQPGRSGRNGQRLWFAPGWGSIAG
jgi:hypothetical protein